MKLTPEYIESLIINEEYFQTTKTIICVLTLKNTYEVVGTSGVVDPKNFDPLIGAPIAKKRAIDKIWELEGYILQEKLFNE